MKKMLKIIGIVLLSLVLIWCLYVTIEAIRLRTMKLGLKPLIALERDNKEEKREYIKTYNVIEKLDIVDETGKYNYYVIKQFQDSEFVLIRVPNTYNLEKEKNYEFVLYGSKIKDKKYTQNEIFENFEIKNITETDKIGLEQIQEL